jgi:hypothetical protein
MAEAPAIRPGDRHLGLLFFKLDSSDYTSSSKQAVIAAEVYIALSEPDSLQGDAKMRRKALHMANKAIVRYSAEKGFTTQAKYKKQRSSVPALVSMEEMNKLITLMRDARNPHLLTRFNETYLPLLKLWLEPLQQPDVIVISDSPEMDGQLDTGAGSPSTSESAQWQAFEVDRDVCDSALCPEPRLLLCPSFCSIIRLVLSLRRPSLPAMYHYTRWFGIVTRPSSHSRTSCNVALPSSPSTIG